MSRQKAGSWKAENIQGMGRKHVGGRLEQQGAEGRSGRGRIKGRQRADRELVGNRWGEGRGHKGIRNGSRQGSR
jgi:hypothetical protein